ncbi:glutathione S-transferase kappa 1 isoform X1 [Carassius auratus]|uniref:Glutathione S-transferase kappa 1 n=1 Tax=Carassius auratus TaxID=7957 RepID=A0A6P6R311_CARAU|nr:glutathione S-transferase kappa 1-like isoform X1 [Carassius auratus]XP_026139679.1 glutathione S-transferase kappa 1-like isoform X1 [Carassius auratus]XP_026139680.1 glutathione S-transferase kappa 1-like isoform X1 [Carassius auratus]XP_026139682.1 glutathione S-transferase kappa 1-like isoform X1 [Carassius auratus]
MSNSRKGVKLFYDVISPYSWLAFEVLCRYRNVWNIDLTLKPAYLTGVIYGSGNQPAGANPSKLMYMVSDLKLTSEYFGVPMFRPSSISEKDSLNAMRFVTAIAEKGKDGDTLERVSRELWKRKWRTQQDITQPASLTDAGLKAGLSANEVEEILTLSKSQPIKDKLKSVTEEALEYRVSVYLYPLSFPLKCLCGKNIIKHPYTIFFPFLQCFGFPFIVCNVNGKAKVFFGSDRFELMAYFFGEKWVGPQPDKPTVQM